MSLSFLLRIPPESQPLTRQRASEGIFPEERFDTRAVIGLANAKLFAKLNRRIPKDRTHLHTRESVAGLPRIPRTTAALPGMYVVAGGREHSSRRRQARPGTKC